MQRSAHGFWLADDCEAEGRRPDPLTAAIASLPRLLGLHVPR